MINEKDSDILIQAEAVYKQVQSSPGAYAAEAQALLLRAREEGATEPLVICLHAVAWCAYARLEHAGAKGFLAEAVRIATRHGHSNRLAGLLVTLAAVDIELGLQRAAQRHLDRAREAAAASDRAAVAHQQAVLYQNSGRFSEAAEQYAELLRLPDVDLVLRAKVGNNLALIESERGRPHAAIGLLEQALVAAADAGPAILAGVTQSRGLVLMQAGRLVESLRAFDEAGVLYQQAGWSLGEHFLEYSDVLVELRLLAEARGAATRACAQFEQHGVLLLAGEAQLRTAHVSLLLGDPQEAVRAAENVVQMMRTQRRPVWVAKAAAVAAEGHLRSGGCTRAQLVAARRAAHSLERMGIASNAVQAHLTAGRLALALGDGRAAATSLAAASQLSAGAPVLTRLKGRLAAALGAQLGGNDEQTLQHCRAGLDDLARHRSALASMELRALASGHGAELGAIGLGALVPRASAARALAWMERTRAAALVSVDAPVAEGVEDKLVLLRSIQAEIAQERRETGFEPAELLQRQAVVEAGIRRASWASESTARTEDTAVSAAELRRLLDGEVLVEYEVLRGVLLAAVVRPRRTDLVRLGPVDAVTRLADSLAFGLRRLSMRRTPASAAAARQTVVDCLQQLAKLLIEPLQLPSDAALVVVPPAALQQLTWAPLHPGPVSVAPSGWFWARARARRSDSTRVLLAAGPELSGAVAEVAALNGVHADAVVLAPPESTADRVAAAMRGARLAHLACHGSLRADNPTFSSLLLSDGPLTLHELTLQGAPPHRIVLAACDSGAGVVHDGNEVLGFASALMARGTAGVLASMVRLPDADSVPLMVALHRRLAAGATMAAALHGARAEIDTSSDDGLVTWCALNAFGAA